MTDTADTKEVALLQSIFERLSDAIYVIDPKTSNIIDVNQAGCDDLGMTRDEVLTHSVLSLQKDVTGLPQWEDIVASIRRAGTLIFVGRHCRKNGSEFPVEVHTNYLKHDQTEYMVSIARDISEREQLKVELQKREHVHRFALHEATDGLWDWTVASGEVYFSPQWKRMMGFGPKEVEPLLDSWKAMVHPDDLERVFEVLGTHLAGSTVRYEAEYRLRTRNGEYLWVHDRGKVVERDSQGEAARVVGMVQNITDRKRLEEKLRTIAHRDELTGLLNRRAGYDYFHRYLSLSERAGKEVGVCLFDIDHFKQVNDQKGHLVGDQVLRHVVNTLETHIRRSDVLFRWGGEEFLLLLPDTHLDDARYVAEKLRRVVHDSPYPSEESEIPVSVSIGVSVGPRDGSSIESLVGQADRALYQAKEKGRNRVVAIR